MSHFTTIKTKIKERPYLIEALKELEYSVLENHLLINPEDHNHNQWNVQGVSYTHLTLPTICSV